MYVSCMRAKSAEAFPWSTSIVFVRAEMTPENIALMELETMGNIVKEVSELLRLSAPGPGGLDFPVTARIEGFLRGAGGLNA